MQIKHKRQQIRVPINDNKRISYIFQTRKTKPKRNRRTSTRYGHAYELASPTSCQLSLTHLVKRVASEVADAER